MHARLYGDAEKWRERQAGKAKQASATSDPNCTFAPTVSHSAKSMKISAAASSQPVDGGRDRFEVSLLLRRARKYVCLCVCA